MSRKFRFVIVACGWSAYPRHLNFLRFEQIANDVSAGERSGASAEREAVAYGC